MLNFHKQKEKFLRAVRTTAGMTGFSEELIEKDYYYSLILKEIFKSKNCILVFKGGTLLNKIHVGFYRLSEDLDFSISAEEGLSRKRRSALAQSAKKSVVSAVKNLSLIVSKPFEGMNENRLYSTKVEYKSLVSENKKTVKIEFGVQEKIWERESLMTKTLLLDSITHKSIVPDFLVIGLSLKEAYSEKIRAALSREKPAVRDIFDIHYAFKNHLIGNKGIKVHDIAPMVKYKLKVVNRKTDLSPNRKKELLSQLQTHLKPVLRQKDFEDFDFEQAWDWLKKLKRIID